MTDMKNDSYPLTKQHFSTKCDVCGAADRDDVRALMTMDGVVRFCTSCEFPDKNDDQSE